jgi:hypothetical protein
MLDMKTLLVSIATAAFAAGAAADDFYHGFAAGNPDLSMGPGSNETFVAGQPGVGDSLDRYHGLDDGNPDLFRTPSTDADQRFSKNPDIYGGFRGSPSLTY